MAISYLSQDMTFFMRLFKTPNSSIRLFQVAKYVFNNAIRTFLKFHNFISLRFDRKLNTINISFTYLKTKNHE